MSRLNEASGHCDAVSCVKKGLCLIHPETLAPGTWHRECHIEAVLGVCVQWTTEFIMSCQLFISTAKASWAWVIIIFLA